MFRMSPWDSLGWRRPEEDDDTYSFGNPLRRRPTFFPAQDYFFDAPTTYDHPAFRASRPSRSSAYRPGYSRAPRRQTFFQVPDEDPYGELPDDSYGAARYVPVRGSRPHTPVPPPPAPAVPLRAVPLAPAQAAFVDSADPDASDDAGSEDGHEMAVPILGHDGRIYLVQPQSQRHRHRRTPKRPQQPPELKAQLLGGSEAAGRKQQAAKTDNVAGSDADSDGQHAADSGCDAGRRAQLFVDPRTGLVFRAVPAAAPTSASQPKAATPPATSLETAARDRSNGSSKVATPAKESPAAAAAAAAAGASTSGPSRTAASAASPQRGSPSAAPGSSGPTRIQVRAVDGRASSAAAVPVVAKATAGAAAAEPSTSLERQGSTALVTRPPMEMALSRGPSASLPAVALAAEAPSGSSGQATSGTVAAAAAPNAPPPATVKVTRVTTSGPSAGTRAAVPLSGRAAAGAAAGAGAAAAAAAKAASAPRMTRSQAARTIQRWWRGWRLWRHSAALRQLVALSRDLRAAAAAFYSYMGATDGNITDKQQLEVNELAMRTILKLDSLEGLPPELKALRRHLTARALKLQDEIQAAYTRSTMRPVPAARDAAAGEAARGPVAAEPAASAAPAPRAEPHTSGPAPAEGAEAPAGGTPAAEEEPHAAAPPSKLAELSAARGGGDDVAPTAQGDKIPPPEEPVAGNAARTADEDAAAGAPPPSPAAEQCGAAAPAPSTSPRSQPVTPPESLGQDEPNTQLHVHVHVGRRPRLAACYKSPTAVTSPRPFMPATTGLAAAAVMASGRAAGQGVTKRVNSRRASPGDRKRSQSASVDGEQADAADSSAPGGRRARRLQRRLSAAAAAAAMAAAAAAAAPAAGGGMPDGNEGQESANGAAAAVQPQQQQQQQRPLMRKLRRQQQQHGQQQQQQQGERPVVLRVVVRPGPEEGNGRGCRTAVLTDASVQTD